LEVSFLGGAGEVGRSCIVVSSGGTKVLLDAGVKLGEETEFPQLDDKELKDISGIFVSHAHLDHCGYLPHLYTRGYSGLVYGTKPTTELIAVLIADYMHISEPKDVTKEALAALSKSYHIVKYGESIRIGALTIKFIPAGHILGSALISVTDGKTTLVYTGDINLIRTKLLDGAEIKNLKADALITESTYGAEEDIFNYKETTRKLIASIRGGVLAGSRIVIPSFAVGRAQEILLLLGDNMKSGAIPKVPIYIDGMINRAMRIHRHNVIFCREELQSSILMSDYDPFKNDNFVPIETKGQRSAIVKKDEAAIIVTTSGMITGGPIMFYLEKMARDSMSKLILVGYQAEGTLGRKIQEGAREITLGGKKIPFEMAIETYHLSAHADRRQLEIVMSSVKGLKKVFIVHGEPSKSESLREKAAKKYEAVTPKIGETYTI
jgi:predicted metal-dependent RNase